MTLSQYLLPILVGCLAVFSVESASAAPARPSRSNDICVYPDPRLLVGDVGDVFDVDYKLIIGKPLRWMFATWGGPGTGEVFVLRCDGRPVAKLGLGAIDGLGEPWMTAEGDVIEARYVDTYGTGINDHTVSLLLFDGKTIRELWTHDSEDTDSITWEPVPGKPGGYEWPVHHEVYKWDYGPDLSTITVAGTHTVEVDGKTRRHRTTLEKFCFRKQALKFVTCK